MPEQVTLFALSDVRALRIECRRCKSGISLRLDVAKDVRVPLHCPSCQTEWKGFVNQQAFLAAQQLLDAIRARWDNLSPPFDFRFEVARAAEPRDANASSK